MTTSVQRRRGTTVQHSTFTGLEGEITVDTTKDTAVVHDGSTVGGFPLAKENLSNVNVTSLSAITGSSTASDDLFIIYDTSTSTIKKITRDELNNAIEQDALANVTITGGSINGTTIGASTASTGAFTTLSASGAFSANGGATLGDASGDALTINSSAVSIPNGLNFDSNTLVIDATNNRVGVGTASPAYALSIVGSTLDINGVGSYPTAQFRASGLTSTTYITGRDSTGSFFTNSGNAPFYWSLNGSESMRLTTTGLGIGATSPNYPLQVRTTGTSTSFAGNIAARLESNGSGYATTLQISNNVDASVTIGLVGSALGFGIGTTERMRLDSSGNLGLGVTPSAWGSGYKAIQLNQQGTIAASSNATYIANNWYQNASSQNTYISTATAGLAGWEGAVFKWYQAPSGTAGNAITFTQAMTLDASGNLMIGRTSAPLSYTRYYADNPTLSGYEAYVGGTRTGFFLAASAASYLGTATSSPLAFSTNDTERMRITSGGDVLVGQTSFATTNNAIKLDAQATTAHIFVGNTSSSALVPCLYLNRQGAEGRSVEFRQANTTVGSISVTASATAYNTSSDYRLKDITGNLTGYKERIMALQPKQGTWKVDGSVFKGFVAHEFAEQYPNAVSGEKDAVDAEGNPVYQGMQAGGSETIADLVAYIHELEARLTALESK